jgi:hypothetical protein
MNNNNQQNMNNNNIQQNMNNNNNQQNINNNNNNNQQSIINLVPLDSIQTIRMETQTTQSSRLNDAALQSQQVQIPGNGMNFTTLAEQIFGVQVARQLSMVAHTHSLTRIHTHTHTLTVCRTVFAHVNQQQWSIVAAK